MPFEPPKAPKRLTTLALATVTAGAALLLAGCTSDPKPAPSTSGNPTDDALSALRQQAELARAKSFTATYRAEGKNPPSSGTIEVYRTPTQARLDITESGMTERVLVGPDGTFLCKIASQASPSSTPCVTLAGPGEALSSQLDLQLQVRHLFTTAPADMADGAGFEVRSAPSRSAKDGSSASSCFAITAAPKSSGVDPGTYCFADGVLMSVEFRTGSLELTKLGGAPDDSAFELPASPVPLASATPS